MTMSAFKDPLQKAVVNSQKEKSVKLISEALEEGLSLVDFY